ncbi:NADase-type glycan-binding domain-containing protein [Streptomyces sp. NPDC090445]|uniref:zinc ribbon domain-containing protein n=1 Tax=Streptomyces sp. NPDC090445 TaxID=3365963 RepID=UPI0038168764
MTTQNCPECGTRAEPGQSFCDACGAVLGWDQGAARAARPADPPSHPHGSAADAARPPHEAARPAGAAPDARTTGGSDTGTPAHAGTTAGPAEAARPGGAAPGSGGSRGPASVPQGTAGPGTGASSEGPGTVGAPGRAESAGAGLAGAGLAGAGLAGPARRDVPSPADGASPEHGASPEDASPSGPAPTGHVPAAPAPHALSDTMSDRARSLLVPVADADAPRPAPAAAAPVLPGRPDTDRPAVRAPGQQPGVEGGPPCRWCSTPNRADRHYCVRCAMPLAETGEAAAPGRAPWWRRLFDGRHRETPWAGDRPRLRRVFDRIGTWITLAVLVALAVLGVVYLPAGIQAARDHFAKRAPVAPDRIAASRSYPGHQPELVFDKRSNTWWGPGVSESGRGEWIEATFSEPTRLLDLVITPGVSARADKTGESALPHRVTATITGKDGKVTTRRLTLDQGAGGQRRPFPVGEVTKVRFTVESSHTTSADKQVAIAEIEFFGPSNANRS